MKKFILLGGIFFITFALNAQTTPQSNHFGTARLDSLLKREKELKIDIDSCLVQISRNSDTDDIAKRLNRSQENLERTQRQIHYIKQIRGTKKSKKN